MISTMRLAVLAVLEIASAACTEDDAGSPGPALSFWQRAQSGAGLSWVEGKPTLVELAESADAVVLARVTRAELGTAIEEPPAGYFEADLSFDALDIIRGSFATNLVVSNGLRASTFDEARAEIAWMNSHLPEAPALFLLRHRTDKPKYRYVNGYGLWIDGPDGVNSPLEPLDPMGSSYAAQVAPYATVEELAESLRPAP